MEDVLAHHMEPFPDPIGPQIHVYGHEPYLNIQIMAKRGDLPRFEVVPIASRKLKGDISMPLLVPPVFVRQVRNMLQVTTGQDARSGGLGKTVKPHTQGRAAQADALILVVRIVESLQPLLDERRIVDGIVPAPGRRFVGSRVQRH